MFTDTPTVLYTVSSSVLSQRRQLTTASNLRRVASYSVIYPPFIALHTKRDVEFLSTELLNSHRVSGKTSFPRSMISLLAQSGLLDKWGVYPEPDHPGGEFELASQPDTGIDIVSAVQREAPHLFHAVSTLVVWRCHTFKATIKIKCAMLSPYRKG